MASVEQKAGNTTKGTLLHRYGLRVPIVLMGIVTGAVTGAITCLYRFLIEKAGELAAGIDAFIAGKPVFVALWFAFLFFLAYLVYLLIKYEPLIKGSGIPQTEGVLLRQIHMKWWKVLVAKFTGGLLSLFAGLSLGREGPSIQLGGAVGQGIHRLLRRPETEEKYMITGGASAGLAAAFNAPLSGVVFALEEVHKHFSPAILLTAMTAAITSDLVSKVIFGSNPVLNFQTLPVLPLYMNLYLLVLGVLAGVGGVVFNFSILKAQDLYAKIQEKFRLFLPFLAAGVVGLLLPGATGGGQNLIMASSAGSFGLKILLVFLIVKFAFTVISFSSGAPGGIFLPLLTVGALLGAVFGTVLRIAIGMQSIYIVSFIALGMAGYFASVVRAPVTGILLITEMTGSFSHLLSLSIVVITAYMTAEMLRSKPIYDALLERLLNGKTPDQPSTVEGKSLIETVVFVDSALDGALIKSIAWPEDCLIVGIRRGRTEVIPNGDTQIHSGDHLILLANASSAAETKKQVLSLATDSTV